MTVPPSKQNPKLYEYERERDIAAGRPRQVSSAASVRKIDALRALGWSATDVADLLGISQAAISRITLRETIRSSTAARIDAAYRRLEMKIPPDTPWTRRNKNAALARGCKPPLAWEDIDAGILAVTEAPRGRVPRDRFDEHEIDHMLQYGEWRHPLSPLEKTEVVRRWLADGRSERSLCKLTGWREGRYTPTHQEAS